ncbi:TolC family protein [Chryseobacterium carnipullorum]|uniref:TolC family protein n=5 Tax=Weeksellaceae TaxID=2762318 RepID=A0A3G6RX98_CHRLC|nr:MULTISPECIES: TolC family protein [Weeksellaceae]AZA81199.1 TolC family protein [Chryseobacterium lactis]AZA48009.1 TolC family protein [Chryseobacterium carnipullorum]AZA67325.1 TolC family protein [Chryseobacterium carnipullorum]AZA87369.1 TolC family protein [Chryseobacterium shandongense]AZA95870.1 TolC family protein [Chryseobacterium shandongense]
MKKLIITAVLAFLYTTIDAQQMSLPAVMDSIAANHPVVKMYNAEIRSMDAAAKGARSWMPPTVGAGFFMTPYNAKLWQRDGDMLGMGSVAVSVEQMFPNRKKLNANENLMKAMSSVEKEKLFAALNENFQDAKKLYYSSIVLDKKLKVVKENEKMLDFMIRNAEIRYKNGLSKISAYYKAKAALGSTTNMQLMYENDLRVNRIRLNALMGRDPLAPLEIEPEYNLNDYSLMTFGQDLFYQNRSDLRGIDREINIAKLKQDLEKQNLKPEFGVKFENMFGFGGQPMQFSLMLMAKLPFVSWASGMNKANIESLKLKEEALQAQKEMMVNEYSGMAYGMRNELDLNKNQLKLYEDTIIPALKKNYKSMQLGYEQNTEELFMLYDAWEQLNMAQLEYFEILTKALQTQTEIDRLIERR